MIGKMFNSGGEMLGGYLGELGGCFAVCYFLHFFEFFEICGIFRFAGFLLFFEILRDFENHDFCLRSGFLKS